jgi:anti-sigma regulatory factor (Ser/Thr protein kinase)
VEIIRNVLEYLKVVDPTNMLLVSRELLKNAVVHGNQNDRSKEVVYRLSRLAQDRIKLEVEDSGSGIGLNNGASAMKRLQEKLDSDELHGRG